MASLKPLTLHAHGSGPNPWKVVMVLEELGMSYNIIYEDLSTIHSEPYTLVNPNGRVPAIVDPNTEITLWESGAIIEYLVETYDKEGKLTSTGTKEKWLQKQFLYFQVSGQGPYYGQWTWFARFHAEKLPSAIERYTAEIKRVMRVLNTVLEGKTYLVGEKCTYADLSFITWASIGKGAMDMEGFNVEKELPNYAAWIERLMARPAVKKTLDIKTKASQAH